ncbi:MAG: amidase domain-containing protein [Clostridiales bacterium]|nr:amidase domain-containing protein [Clostridiales bacterium]
MQTVAYNRERAAAYAKAWALRRNPAYYDFSGIGGDCTNYASQCLFAGSGQMNFTPVFGWYYLSANERTASWTGVQFFYDFLTGNEGLGPFATEAERSALEIGDFVQLGREDGGFYHTPVVTGFKGNMPLVSAHSYNAYNRPLDSYAYARIRYLHIACVRIPDGA